jgi:hypothetical protein
VEQVADGKAARRDCATLPSDPAGSHLPHISGKLLTQIKQDERFAKTIIIITTADVWEATANRQTL